MPTIKQNHPFTSLELVVIEATINGHDPRMVGGSSAGLTSIQRDIAAKVGGRSWAHTISQIWALGLVHGGVMCLCFCLLCAAINPDNQTDFTRQPARILRPLARRARERYA